MRINVYPQGITINRDKVLLSLKSNNTPLRKKGDITSFSRKSRQRLRLILSKYSSDEMQSVTLTLPSSAPQQDIFDYSYFWHDFVSHYMRTFNFPWLWRIELQKKRALPHWHLCLFGTSLEKAYLVSSRWRDCCSKWFEFSDKSWLDFCRYGVNISPCVNTSNTLSYLVDHTSKRKSDQLGWKGRQWGIVNKTHLKTNLCEHFELTRHEVVLVCRELRKLKKSLNRYNVYSSISPFVTEQTLFSSFYGRDMQRLKKVIHFIKKK